MGTERRGSAGDKEPRWGGDVRISDDEWVKDPKTGEMRLSEQASRKFFTRTVVLPTLTL